MNATWTYAEIEAAAKAIAWRELTPLGRRQCKWLRDFGRKERAEYRGIARAALGAVSRRSRRGKRK